MDDYDSYTKEQLIAEIRKIKKFKSLLVSAILHHYRKDDKENHIPPFQSLSKENTHTD